MPNLPEGIIYDVLSRLPVVSLCRFRCVSKPWRSLISSPHFIRTHLNRNNSPNKFDRLIIRDQIQSNWYALDLDSSQSRNLFTALVPVTFPSVQNPLLPWMEICYSCDGLVLILDGDLDCFLVNPSTRESRKVPRPPFTSCPQFTNYGFGYDSSIDDYKVINICYYHERGWLNDNVVSLYSLKTNSWRRIENYPYDRSCFGRRPGDFVCGALHWAARHSNGTDNVIVALDLADEKFRTVSCPVIGWTWTGVLRRCLCVFVELLHGPYGLDAWVMKEYDVSDSWTKIITITYDSSLCSRMWRPRPLSLPQTGRVLFITEGYKLFIFDPREEEAKEVAVPPKKVAVHGLPARFEIGTYVESLVSPWRLCQ